VEVFCGWLGLPGSYELKYLNAVVTCGYMAGSRDERCAALKYNDTNS
jgi:hypothetical protein